MTPIPKKRKSAWRKFKRRSRRLAEYGSLRFLAFVLRALPIDAASGMMAAIWAVFGPFSRRHAQALAHVALAYPEKTPQDHRRIVRSMWRNLGRVFAESFMIDKIVRNKKRIDNKTNDLLDFFKNSNKSIVFVSLHTGNWELVIVPTIGAGIKVAGVYQRLKNPWVETMVFRLRRPWYPGGLFAKSPETGRRLLRIIREKGAVAMLADLRDRRGAMVPFFGRLAPSTVFPALLARSSDAVLVAARVVRLQGARFRIEGEEVPVPRTGDPRADAREATRLTQALFESWVREYPGQWMWIHRRWG